MRIVVIGGSGHIGSFLVPRLVRAGHEVISMSRGERKPYVADPAWKDVQTVVADREAQEHDGTFPGHVAWFGADVVVDLICFDHRSAEMLVDRLRGDTAHYVFCGSIWRHGPVERMPLTEDSDTPAVGEYGIEKADITHTLKNETAAGGLVTTSLHPGHIVGPGWHPIGPLGNLDPGVWRTLSAGEPLAVPGLGAEFLHHVHADDVAQAFEKAVEHRDAAAGEDFDIVAPTALNVRGLARIAASWFGKEADLRFVSWDEFRRTTSEGAADASWEHLVRSQYASIDKARRVLGYAPRYQPEEAILEAVRWLIDNGRLDVPSPLVGAGA